MRAREWPAIEIAATQIDEVSPSAWRCICTLNSSPPGLWVSWFHTEVAADETTSRRYSLTQDRLVLEADPRIVAHATAEIANHVQRLNSLYRAYLAEGDRLADLTAEPDH